MQLTQAPAPGARALIRDKEWIIQNADQCNLGGWQLSCIGVSETVRNRHALFLTELEDITLIHPDGCRESKRLGWDDVMLKDGKPQLADGTVSERWVLDDTQPSGPINRVIRYTAPLHPRRPRSRLPCGMGAFCPNGANN